MNRRMNAREIESAKTAAREAMECDRRQDAAARDRALMDLFGAAGYWLNSSGVSRNSMPPKMLRMPAGRSVPWASNRWAAAEAWAQAS